MSTRRTSKSLESPLTGRMHAQRSSSLGKAGKGSVRSFPFAVDWGRDRFSGSCYSHRYSIFADYVSLVICEISFVSKLERLIYGGPPKLYPKSCHPRKS
jgi:hypothetical protein